MTCRVRVAAYGVRVDLYHDVEHGRKACPLPGDAQALLAAGLLTVQGLPKRGEPTPLGFTGSLGAAMERLPEELAAEPE